MPWGVLYGIGGVGGREMGLKGNGGSGRREKGRNKEEKRGRGNKEGKWEIKRGNGAEMERKDQTLRNGPMCRTDSNPLPSHSVSLWV